ncbi:cell division control protein 48 homolog B [Anopheles arabiensis]|uniref:cell division control protein 48 homolog B n=1 Tax=Anopheles arabiensis TaxID=7173 RepID=UPI001AAD6DD6|nr:cell division control protein 48 homolog B [Anopheles arabiensis]
MVDLNSLTLKFNTKLEPAFSLPQSCYIWPKASERNQWTLFPGVPAECRLQNGRRLLWRVYSHLDGNSTHREAYFAYQTVELEIEAPASDIASEENILVEIRPIQPAPEDFQAVTVDVQLDCSRLKVDLLLTKECLADTLATFLKGTFFCKGCRIDFTGCLRDRNMGICGVYVKETQGPSVYGEVDRHTVIKIDQILYHPATLTQKPLGGIDGVREQLEAALTESRSLLLIGPSGSGKYSLVKSVISERNLPLFEIRGLHFLRSLPGETEAELRQTFLRLRLFQELIEREKPAILLVKDIDTICPKIGAKKGEDVVNIARIASQFLSLVDQYRESAENVIIIGTTSSVESMDTRLRRPGRLDKEITLGIPSKEQRIDILRCFYATARGTLTDEQLDLVGQRTAGYVGAELELLYYNLVREMHKQQLPFEEALAEIQKKHRPSNLRNATGLVGREATLSLDSFGGMDELKALLRLCIVEQLANPARFQRLGIHPLRGILLYGPPGCAKTTLAKCLAAETGMTFLSLSAAQVYSPYVGDAEKLITRVFNEARTNAPAVVFLDEIDSLVGNRGTGGMKGGSGAVNMGVLSTLLMEMDGIGQAEQAASALSEDAKRVVVIAATNRPDMVDDALLRPGRLTKLIHVPAPDGKGRLEILRKIATNVPFAEDVQLELVAEQTERYSGADLQNLCTQAALNAATEDLNATVVTMAHLRSALQDVRPSLTKEQIDWYHSYEANRLR